MIKKITITMWRDEALMLGLLVCKCGHRPNNHFEHDKKPCAHCKCRAYVEVPIAGTMKDNP